MSDLTDAKVGDTIKCLRRFATTQFDLFKVVRLTATQVVCTAIGAATEYEQKFKRTSSLMIGSSDKWSNRYGSIATPEDFAAIALRNRIQSAQEKLSRFRVTAENIDAIKSILKASKP